MKRVNSFGNGDHYVHIKIAIPKKLTDEQKALVQVIGQFIPQLVQHQFQNSNGCAEI